MTAKIQRRELSAWALLVAQVVHGLTPADTRAEGSAGSIGGLLLLCATMAAIFGLRTGRPWAPRLLGVTGAVVALGFVLYHALPIRSAVTNPYLGEPVGAPAWISVAFCVGAGLWATREGLTTRVPSTAEPIVD